ncbi:helix-turn-helix domain-containing protein [Arthrobacter sp. K5]|jgi:predicted DNA-binding transcriptional regulator AlpA|uniref:Helix-turn-helix domain-containing protein n=1 Tax=Arthrobacter sp. K5 TaxID=2839623 RepID=A0AAU8EPM3_9MICC
MIDSPEVEPAANSDPVENDDRRAKYPPHLVLYTLEGVAAMCGISRSTAYRHLKEKLWPRHRIGTDLKFSEPDIEAIQARYRQAAELRAIRVVGNG